MKKIKKGDIVGRKSYGKDILFTVEKIIQRKNEPPVAILKGLIIRIEADALLDDLVIMETKQIQTNMRSLEEKLEDKMKQYNIKPKQTSNGLFRRSFLKRENRGEENGKILHLDGDKRYSDKSVFDLLNRYKPDVLVITGHDGMIKNGTGFNDIYNYRNSKYFINTVKEAKKWVSQTENDLVIFAGACQSYYEALVAAGANFASSPARVLIDFMDPLIVAEKVATTESYKYITINDIADELRDGTRGISGIGARGKRYTRLKITDNTSS